MSKRATKRKLRHRFLSTADALAVAERKREEAEEKEGAESVVIKDPERWVNNLGNDGGRYMDGDDV